MRHQYSVKKLGRKSSHRNLMVINLMKSLLTHRSLETTISKAKVLQSNIDRLFTIAKRENKQMAYREVFSILNDENLTNKVFDYYLKQLERNSGYTTRYILKNRKGDNAVLVLVKLLTKEEEKVIEKGEKADKKTKDKKDSKKEVKKESKEKDKKEKVQEVKKKSKSLEK